MGQSSSSTLPTSLPTQALHILRVADHSPAQTHLEPFFDYLVSIDAPRSTESHEEDASRSGSYGDLTAGVMGRILEDNIGREVTLRVYNAKSQRIREVRLIPNRTWGSSDTASGSGSKTSLLGLSLRVCNPANALESVYHVLDVLEGSPAEMAGLVPWGDFVLAWSGGPLHSENDFYKLIESHVDKPLRLFVYNSDLDNLREVVLYPTRQWGGDGLIGCGIGYGLLHRIPRPSTPPPIDGYFSSDSNRISESRDRDTFTPAQLVQAPAPEAIAQ